MLKGVLRSYLINLFALWLVSQTITGFQLAEGAKSVLLVAAGFTALHLFLKPILSALLGSLNFLTLGIIGLLIDSAILFILTIYFPEIRITAWFFAGFSEKGFSLPAYNLNVWQTTILSAGIINIIRGTLTFLSA